MKFSCIILRVATFAEEFVAKCNTQLMGELSLYTVTFMGN